MKTTPSSTIINELQRHYELSPEKIEAFVVPGDMRQTIKNIINRLSCHILLVQGGHRLVYVGPWGVCRKISALFPGEGQIRRYQNCTYWIGQGQAGIAAALLRDLPNRFYLKFTLSCAEDPEVLIQELVKRQILSNELVLNEDFFSETGYIGIWKRGSQLQQKFHTGSFRQYGNYWYWMGRRFYSSVSKFVLEQQKKEKKQRCKKGIEC